MAPLIRPVSAGVRPQPFHFSQEYLSRTLAEDRPIIERSIAAYHYAIESAPLEMRQAMAGSIWGDQGLVGKQSQLIAALEAGSSIDLHDILCRYFLTDAAFGIAMGSRDYEAVTQSAGDLAYHGFMWLDRLVGLAHAVGSLPVPNPEDSPERWERCLEIDAEAVLSGIESHIGLRLEFPDICGVFGGGVRGKALPFIAFTHLLVALTMRDLMKERRADRPLGTIFEIGGGFGGLAYFCCRLLPCVYTIFDLPWANAVQAYFLERAMPGTRLRLCGESMAASAGIMLLPAWELLRQPAEKHADLVVNQDSMPEMPQKIVQQYLAAMKGLLRGPFLSINQEPAAEADVLWDRSSVARAVEQVGGYDRIIRAPFSLRLGYVLEVYYPAICKRRPFHTAYRLIPHGDLVGFGKRFKIRVSQWLAARI